ncbi:NADH dehydrogenase subunit C [Thiogranum longum]|uniref:NADH-quinone oxidoreductase subunit C n=1 Tax=Thiogranum longum TaxID=1537524 RepID=A0A4V2PGY7_9GAMM|nr:NADH-quinone oxidoreductase subunit C [Thiogranum longum]TCK18666.1 NADH dehydrogenase subunit C [Thiogranum longum]
MQAKELLKQLQERFGDTLHEAVLLLDEVTIEIAPDDLLDTCRALRDEREFGFEQLIDVCGVDYLNHGVDEWATEETTTTGFSRGVDPKTAGRLPGLEEDLSVETPQQDRRFAAVYHLLSVTHNHRLRIRVYAPDLQLPVIPSVVEIWNGADWFEREAFDLFGILFEGHPDLRRILTDYGFIGHPFRKDFPLSGNVEVRYDPEKRRVVYQPVSIEPRVLVPKVIRGDELEPVTLDEAGDSDSEGEDDA